MQVHEIVADHTVSLSSPVGKGVCAGACERLDRLFA